MGGRYAIVVAMCALAGLAATAHGQKKKESPEFTRQGLLIVNFAPGAGADFKLGRHAADVVRDRVAHFVDKKQLDVIDGDAIRIRLVTDGFSPDTSYSVADAHAIGRFLRADEFLLAHVASTPAGVRLWGELVLLRDDQLRQAIAPATASRLDSAATLFAKNLIAARTQLIHERRCENALRDGHGAAAIAAAREGIAAYPRATIARVCLVWALRQASGAGVAPELLDQSRAILAVDSVNKHALEGAAVALDSLRRRSDAADMWLRLAATDTGDVDLQLRISYALFDGGNAKRDEPFIAALVAGHPADFRLIQQEWRVAYENKSWPRAIESGAQLLAQDSVAQRDSVFYYRLATAYHESGRPFDALETALRGVSTFPKDARIYTLYTQYVKAEADTVLPRGLALFPTAPVLLALNAKELRAKGKIAESLDATKQALSIDSTMSQGRLMVAQLELELGRPDSALVALHRAAASGEDSSLIAQFALSKGNGMYRAANGTKASNDFNLALRFVSFADSVRSNEQSKFLVGAAALGVVQASLTEAAAQKDKSEGCRLVHVASDLIPMARTGLQAGGETFAEASKQSLDYLGQLDPYVGQGLQAFCGEKPPKSEQARH